MAANIVSYIWKWMPFWTLIFLAGRMAIPQDIYEAAEIDGASGYRRLIYVTFPLLANVYLICTLLSTRLDAGRLPHGVFRLQRRAGATDRCAGHLWLPRGVRLRLSEPRRGGDDVGAAVADPAGDPADAAGPRDGGAAMSIALTADRAGVSAALSPAPAGDARLAAMVLGIVLLIWTLLPVYNMLLMALESTTPTSSPAASGRRIRICSSFRVGLERRLLADGAFLAPVRQQHLHGRRRRWC